MWLRQWWQWSRLNTKFYVYFIKYHSSDSFLTQDTRDSKKLAEERAHEAKLKNETSINADSDNSQTKSKDSSNSTKSKETEENDQDEATENNDAKDESWALKYQLI